MRKQQKILYYIIPVLAALALAACGPAAAIPAPTQTVSAIYTSAFFTFTAQQATKSASTPTSAPPTQAAPATAAPTTGAANPGVPITGGTAAPGGMTGSLCNNSVYVNDATIPDGTVMPPGQTFTKAWTIMNTGTCPWTPSYKLAFVTGELMGGQSVPLEPLPPNAETQVSVNLTAPTMPGNYTGSWQLVDPQGNRFGEIVTVVIVVRSGAATIAPIVTATP